MRGSRAVPGLVPILMIALTGCDSQDPLEPTAGTAGDRVSVRIEGPEVILQAGTYNWRAVTDGEGDYQYIWEVDWLDAEESLLSVHGQELELILDRPRDVELRVRVLQGGRTVASARHGYGHPCDGELLLVEDYRIDVCQG